MKESLLSVSIMGLRRRTNYCKHAAIPRAGPNGLGAQPRRIGYTEVPFQGTVCLYSSVLYRITTIVSKPTITWTHGT